jgi:Protein kinase domain
LSLAAGTRLGPYEVLSALGAGGMGEVYKARDTRLDRIVAIKILPPHVAANPELRTRFEREARAVSSLDHPNICVRHDVGSATIAHNEAIEFLVMQYLEGETLAARLGRGPLPLAEALRYAIEIAGALDKRGGGVAPAWCRACRELYYQSAAGMMAVSYTAKGSDVVFAEPRLLFKGITRWTAPRTDRATTMWPRTASVSSCCGVSRTAANLHHWKSSSTGWRVSAGRRRRVLNNN